MWFLIFIFYQIKEAKAIDTPNDRGSSITLSWVPIEEEVIFYKIMRSENGVSYDSIGSVIQGVNTFQDEGVEDGKNYWYKIIPISPKGELESVTMGPVVSSAQWFHKGRVNVLILSIIICGLALFFIRKAKRGEKLFIRKIAGLEAVDDAVGRATEMGRPILYSLGLGDMSEIATLASLSILNRVAKRAALHNTPLIVPCYYPVVMAAAQETVKEAHLEVGRPDTYDESKIFFLTSSQFGYAAGVDGIIVREKPGAIFLQGWFYAESLILAETGASVGAIQIAGTPATAQLPFFVTACDYTLIGEEMYVASSYLSKEPTLVGSIKGEDYSKIILLIVISVGVVLATLTKLNLIEWGIKFINWFTPV
jgi:hypothetical protein